MVRARNFRFQVAIFSTLDFWTVLIIFILIR